MDNGYQLLTEKEEIWARMLLQVLSDHGIPCMGIPVYGAGFAMSTGTRERIKVYVLTEEFARAAEFMDELFSGEPVFEEIVGAEDEKNA